ncbi:hypothetical protein HOC80_03580 [archaeon]|jgi:hypothetical protein|nr:hypothetical protein [archaeon]MBT4417158.1 hypothetical protein [archaeon]
MSEEINVNRIAAYIVAHGGTVDSNVRKGLKFLNETRDNGHHLQLNQTLLDLAKSELKLDKRALRDFTLRLFEDLGGNMSEDLGLDLLVDEAIPIFNTLEAQGLIEYTEVPGEPGEANYKLAFTKLAYVISR